MRALLGLVAAPPAPVLVFLVFETFPHVYRPFFTEGRGVFDLVFWCLAVAYGLAALAGVPAFLLLKRLRRVSFPPIAATGALIAASVPVAMELYRLLTVRPDFAYSYYAEGCQLILSDERTACGYKLLFLDLVVFAALGFGTAIVFWAIYRGNTIREALAGDDQGPGRG